MSLYFKVQSVPVMLLHTCASGELPRGSDDKKDVCRARYSLAVWQILTRSVFSLYSNQHAAADWTTCAQEKNAGAVRPITPKGIRQNPGTFRRGHHHYAAQQDSNEHKNNLNWQQKPPNKNQPLLQLLDMLITSISFTCLNGSDATEVISVISLQAPHSSLSH